MHSFGVFANSGSNIQKIVQRIKNGTFDSPDHWEFTPHSASKPNGFLHRTDTKDAGTPNTLHYQENKPDFVTQTIDLDFFSPEDTFELTFDIQKTWGNSRIEPILHFEVGAGKTEEYLVSDVNFPIRTKRTITKTFKGSEILPDAPAGSTSLLFKIVATLPAGATNSDDFYLDNITLNQVVHTHVVHFEGDSVLPDLYPDKVVSKGALLTGIPSPTKADFSFLGWSKQGTMDIIDLATFTVDEDITLVAQWDPVPQGEGKSLLLSATEIPAPETFITNRGNLPAGAQYVWTGVVPTVKTDSIARQNAKVWITYPGTSYTPDEVDVWIDFEDDLAPRIEKPDDQEYDEKKQIVDLVLNISDAELLSTDVSNLPQGLTYNPDTKTISGTPTEIGTKKVTVRAQDKTGHTTELTFNITIKDKTAPEIGIVHPNPDPAREKIFSWTGSDNYSLEDKLQLSYALVDDGVACDETQSFIAGTTVTLSDETYNGKRICVKAEDEAGNISYKLSEAITGIDKTAPLAPKLENKRWKRKKPDFVYILPLVNEEKETLTVVSVENLPEGLEYKDGKIVGTPTKKETKKVLVTYQDTAGNQVKTQFDIKIYTDGGSVIISSSSEPEKKPEPKPEEKKPVPVVEDQVFNSTVENGKCYTRRELKSILDSTKISTTEEFKKALSFMWSYEMTMYDSVDDYDPYRNLSREEAAKMFSNFAMNVLCRKPDKNLKINYSDTENADPSLKPYIELAYQLGVMKGSGKGDGEFRPFDYISKAEVNAVLIRMILKSYLDESGSLWYWNYNKVAESLKIITKGAGGESLPRNNVALMLFRAYKHQEFEWKEIGYFSFVLKLRDLFVK